MCGGRVEGAAAGLQARTGMVVRQGRGLLVLGDFRRGQTAAVPRRSQSPRHVLAPQRIELRYENWVIYISLLNFFVK